jgi:hypothetical protein
LTLITQQNGLNSHGKKHLLDMFGAFWGNEFGNTQRALCPVLVHLFFELIDFHPQNTAEWGHMVT